MCYLSFLWCEAEWRATTYFPTIKRNLTRRSHFSLFVYFGGQHPLGLVRKAVNDGRKIGIKLNRYCPILSHLVFVDDSIFFRQKGEGMLESYIDTELILLCVWASNKLEQIWHFLLFKLSTELEKQRGQRIESL